MHNHTKQFNRMFRVGATWGHERRVANATTSTNVPPPPLYGLRKDHKPVPHPVRPVCGARISPNSRLGHFLSRVINDYVDCEESQTECHSSEEMRAAFEAFNNLDKNERAKCKIISMDIKALYPSMSWEQIIVSVKELILQSDMNILNVDWQEVGNYLALMMTEEEIENEGLVEEECHPKEEGCQTQEDHYQLPPTEEKC